MSMNKYISGIINCLDTVPSLKKKLVQIFKKLDSDLNTINKADVTTTQTVSTDYLNGLRINGKLVECNLNVSGVTGSGTTVLGTIPATYAPTKPILITISVSGNFGYCTIDNMGNIYTTMTLNNASVRIHALWFIE